MPFKEAGGFDYSDLLGSEYSNVGYVGSVSRRRSRKGRKRNRKRPKSHSNPAKVIFTTKEGKRVSFTPKSRHRHKRTARRGNKKRPYPHHLKKYMFKKARR